MSKDRAPPVETRRQIEEQTAAFLKRGGKIQYICNGVSGQTFPTGRKSVPMQGRQIDATSEISPASRN